MKEFVVCEMNDQHDFNIKHFVSGDQKATAIVGLWDDLAIHFLALARDAGLRVPEDVAIVSFETRDKLDGLEYNITAVKMPVEQMGTAGSGDSYLPAERGHAKTLSCDIARRACCKKLVGSPEKENFDYRLIFKSGVNGKSYLRLASEIAFVFLSV